MKEEEFYNDLKTCQASVLSLEQIGENARKLSQEFKDQYKNIPWQKITDTRNLIAHGYSGINWKLIWKTLTIDVSGLLRFIEDILKEK
jgi:uncharacterized protein with HEPN domain